MMNRKAAWWDPRANPVAWVAGALVLSGFLLPGKEGQPSQWVILLTGLGTFGPGILRELGWLRDKDEFQLQAARRAGYHAFLVAGLAAFLWIAFIRSGPRHLKNPEELATFFAAILWFTWMLSALLSYWGARKTAFRILLLYGIAWLAFNILGNLRSPVAMVMQCLLTVPFFGCAWLSRKWPRAAGLLLLASSVFFIIFIMRIHQARGLGMVVSAITLLLFAGPLFASGLALLSEGAENLDADTEEPADPIADHRRSR
jgi:hypothetical protein